MIPLRYPQPFALRTRASIGPRDPEALPEAPEALGGSLMSRVEAAVERGLPRPVALGISPTHVEQFDLVPLLKAQADLHRFVSAVAGQEGMEVVALLGTFGVRFGRVREPRCSVICFLEWPDGAWWSALRPLDDKALREDWPAVVRSAWEGYARPGGLGGWWARSRREQLKLRLGPLPGQPGAGMVH
ncbi:MAG: hypothetical protein H6741_35510 [Alphaproteobacteria bacterium]|nr:hypothetical protein [Alphaproteobacteria bacterium]MCB9798016.1 hypothetical protein [Alphaproteobacteria bacterium]